VLFSFTAASDESQLRGQWSRGRGPYDDVGDH